MAGALSITETASYDGAPQAEIKNLSLSLTIGFSLAAVTASETWNDLSESVRFDFRVSDISLSSSGFLSAASFPVKRNGNITIQISALRCFMRGFLPCYLSKEYDYVNSLRLGIKALK